VQQSKAGRDPYKKTRCSAQPGTEEGGSHADWGLVSRKRVMNPFVTLDALHLRRAAGRLNIDQACITS
jgi:hypothetical protein